MRGNVSLGRRTWAENLGGTDRWLKIQQKVNKLCIFTNLHKRLVLLQKQYFKSIFRSERIYIRVSSPFSIPKWRNKPHQHPQSTWASARWDVSSRAVVTVHETWQHIVTDRSDSLTDITNTRKILFLRFDRHLWHFHWKQTILEKGLFTPTKRRELRMLPAWRYWRLCCSSRTG